jgi:hypothetical protein
MCLRSSGVTVVFERRELDRRMFRHFGAVVPYSCLVNEIGPRELLRDIRCHQKLLCHSTGCDLIQRTVTRRGGSARRVPRRRSPQ